MTTIRERSTAALAEALEAMWDTAPVGVDSDVMPSAILAASPTLARRLDFAAAWDEAVAALPKGYVGPMLWPAPLGGEWHAVARDHRITSSRVADFKADGPTPTDALVALAERLTGSGRDDDVAAHRDRHPAGRTDLPRVLRERSALHHHQPRLGEPVR